MIKALNDPSILAMVVCGVVLIAVIKAVSGGKETTCSNRPSQCLKIAGTAGAEYEAGTAGSQDPADTAGAQDPAGTAGKPVVGVLVPKPERTHSKVNVRYQVWGTRLRQGCPSHLHKRRRTDRSLWVRSYSLSVNSYFCVRFAFTQSRW